MPVTPSRNLCLATIPVPASGESSLCDGCQVVRSRHERNICRHKGPDSLRRSTATQEQSQKTAEPQRIDWFAECGSCDLRGSVSTVIECGCGGTTRVETRSCGSADGERCVATTGQRAALSSKHGELYRSVLVCEDCPLRVDPGTARALALVGPAEAAVAEPPADRDTALDRASAGPYQSLSHPRSSSG